VIGEDEISFPVLLFFIGDNMRYNKMLIITVFLLFLSMLSVSAMTKQEIQDRLENVSDDTSRPVNVTHYQKISSEKLPPKTFSNVTSSGTRVSFRGLQDPENISKFNVIDDPHFASKGIQIENATVDNATIVLEKTAHSLGQEYRIMHSDDGNTWEEKDIPYKHNSTHIWFNVTHFSAWTTFLESPLIVHETITRTIDLGDYANIDLDSYVTVDLQTGSGSVVLSDFSGSDSWSVYDEAGENIVYDITLQDTTTSHIIEITPRIGSAGFSDSTFTITVRDGDTGNGELVDNTGLEIQTVTEPDIFTYSASDITSDSAQLNAEVVLNDYDEVDKFFQYRKQGASTWEETLKTSSTSSTGTHSPSTFVCPSGHPSLISASGTSSSGTQFGTSFPFSSTFCPTIV